jgi:hypothetical protein
MSGRLSACRLSTWKRIGFVGLLCTASLHAQQPLRPLSGQPAPIPTAAAPAASLRPEGNTGLAPVQPLPGAASVARPSVARVTSGSGNLPNGQGQVWREYDLTPYTQRLPGVKKPESAIVDWILRETGYEAWHGDVVTVLNADSSSLRVYHTLEIQTIVNDIVDRFVNPDLSGYGFGVRLISVGSPAWRGRASAILKPVAVQTPGAQAWMVAKEDAALLVGELRKRTDYREHSNPQLVAANGQTLKTAAQRPRSFVQGFQLGNELWRGGMPLTASLQEGYTLEVTPLVGHDAKTVDMLVRCDIDQVEKMHLVPVDIPTAAGQKANLEVPQLAAHRVHERFRWSGDAILIIGLGVVPTATPGETSNSLMNMVSTAPPRTDLLLFIEPRGKAGAAPANVPAPNTAARPTGVGR